MDFSLYRSMDADKRQIYGRRRLYTILYIARTLWWRNFRANLPFSAQWLLTHNSPSLFHYARHSSTTHMREMLWRPSQARRLQHWRRLILSTRLLLEISFSNWPVPDDPCAVISTATSHHQWPSCHYFVNNSNATYIYVGGELEWLDAIRRAFWRLVVVVDMYTYSSQWDVVLCVDKEFRSLAPPRAALAIPQ